MKDLFMLGATGSMFQLLLGLAASSVKPEECGSRMFHCLFDHLLGQGLVCWDAAAGHCWGSAHGGWLLHS